MRLAGTFLRQATGFHENDYSVPLGDQGAMRRIPCPEIMIGRRLGLIP